MKAVNPRNSASPTRKNRTAEDKWWSWRRNSPHIRFRRLLWRLSIKPMLSSCGLAAFSVCECFADFEWNTKETKRTWRGHKFQNSKIIYIIMRKCSNLTWFAWFTKATRRDNRQIDRTSSKSSPRKERTNCSLPWWAERPRRQEAGVFRCAECRKCRGREHVDGLDHERPQNTWAPTQIVGLCRLGVNKFVCPNYQSCENLDKAA